MQERQQRWMTGFARSRDNGAMLLGVARDGRVTRQSAATIMAVPQSTARTVADDAEVQVLR